MVIPKKHSEVGPLRNVWRAFNELRDFAVSLRMAQGRGIKFHRTAHGTVARLENLGGAAEVTESTGEMKRARITEVHTDGDKLLARQYNATGTDIEGDNFWVAVPKYLRSATYGSDDDPENIGPFEFRGLGKVNHPANEDADYAVRSVFPPYEVGQDVYVLKPSGKTDVTLGDGTRVEWVDCNVEGRSLATNLTLVNVCRVEGGQNITRKILVEAGPIH